MDDAGGQPNAEWFQEQLDQQVDHAVDDGGRLDFLAQFKGHKRPAFPSLNRENCETPAGEGKSVEYGTICPDADPLHKNGDTPTSAPPTPKCRRSRGKGEQEWPYD